MSKQIQLNTIDFGGTTKGCDCDSGLAPIINKDTNTWLVWDNERGVYVDTGVVAGVGTEDFYASTYWVFNEIASGKKVIAKALTDRKYPTSNDESFVDMADKITNMSYKEGWFAKIGYTDDNDGGIKDAINYSYELAKGWNPDGSTMKIFTGNVNLIILPAIETKNCTTLATLCQGCSNLLFASLIDAKSATSLNYIFGNTKLTKLNIKNTQRVSIYSYALIKTNVTKVDSFDFSSVTAMTGCFNSCSCLVFLLVRNIGKSSLTTYDFSDATSWGTGSEENRQSLIDSLITYSYDRASNGMATATITLSANTKTLLTDEEIAQITAKGFTIA